MHIICLTPLEDGVYNDHNTNNINIPPSGWAMIPDDMELPSTFPRLGSISAENVTHTREVETVNDSGNIVTVTKEYSVMTVTSMTAGTLPENEVQSNDNTIPLKEVTTRIDVIEDILSTKLTNVELVEE